MGLDIGPDNSVSNSIAEYEQLFGMVNRGF